MDPQLFNQLKEVFTPIAQKIGETADFGWEIVMKQQYVYAVEGLICAIIGLLAIPVYFKVLKYAREQVEKDSYSGWEVGQTLFGIFGGIIIAFMIIGGAETAISHFINPAYYAIDFFIHLTKSN